VNSSDSGTLISETLSKIKKVVFEKPIGKGLLGIYNGR
jgi:hypothetical protein